jgi:leucyl aminopeptidase
MKISVHGGAPHERKGDVLVYGVFEAEAAKPAAKKAKKKAKKASSRAPTKAHPLKPRLGEIDDALGGHLLQAVAAEGFTGASGQALWMNTLGKAPADRVVLVGLGKAEDLELDGLRKLGGRAAKAGNRVKAKKVILSLPQLEDIRGEAAVEATFEGALMSSYRFDRYLSKNDDAPTVTTVEVVTDLEMGGLRHAVRRAQAVAEGVDLARDLVNECAGALNPLQFAKEAQTVGKATGIKVDVFAEPALKREKMGLMLAVAQAAQPYTPPRLVRLHYKPKGKARKRIALVGKGLTFDSGGLDLKPAAGMLDMKIDMSGAAAVLGTMLAVGHLKPNVEVIAYLGCVENGIGGNAYHPGDVITSRTGITVEVNNTDAEGRLVLADCIDYTLTKDKPDVLIDLATLTGACMVALGPSTAGLFSSSDDLAEDIKSAGQRAGEDFWRLPLNKDLAGQLKSPIADTKNTGERWGGAITAALFLQKFVDDRADWAHLDIAGPATNGADHDYTPKGGAGFGVRTLMGVIDPL